MYIGEVKGSNFMEGYVYILKSSENGAYYIGSTIDLERRLIEHNSGKTKSLKNILPVELVFSQMYENIQTARRIEFKIKRFKSRDITERIIADGKIIMGR